jgi:hypothetical protein
MGFDIQLPSEEESPQMKKFLSILLISALFSVIAANAFAEGDKNHGDKGKGKVNRAIVSK